MAITPEIILADNRFTERCIISIIQIMYKVLIRIFVALNSHLALLIIVREVYSSGFWALMKNLLHAPFIKGEIKLNVQYWAFVIYIYTYLWTQAKLKKQLNVYTNSDIQYHNVGPLEFLRLYVHNIFIDGAQSPS